jgi:hypothetical protein
MNRILFVIVAFFPSVGFGQVNDAGLWSSVNLETKLAKKVGLEVATECRLNENFSELGTIYSEMLVSYKISKPFQVSVGYRYIAKRRYDDSYSIRHRLLINMSYRKKTDWVIATLRLRYQSQFTDVNKSDNWRVPEDYLRAKIAFKFETPYKWKPYFSSETFYHLNDPDGVLFRDYRLAAGIDYSINKKTGVNLGYLIDKEVNVSNPWTNYVITLGLNLEL